MSESTALTTTRPQIPGLFSQITTFEDAQRMATALSKSAMVPQSYQNDVANCLVALDIAQRVGANPLMVMQNLHVIHGKPSWSGQYVISAINSSGRFGALDFEMTGEQGAETWGCRAVAEDKQTGKIRRGTLVTIGMAKKEGWYGKSGSKWQTMPELMLQYRAATFFGRVYCPEILMGMRVEGEPEDMEPRDVTPATTKAVPESAPAKPTGSAAIREQIKRGPGRPPKAAAVVETKAAPVAPAPEQEAAQEDFLPPADGQEGES